MIKSRRIHFLLLAVILMVAGSVVAQTADTYFLDKAGQEVPGHRCGTYTPSREETEIVSREINSWLAAGGRTADKAVVTIPVAVHVVAEDDGYGDISDAAINAQMKVLVDAYRGTNFTFTLASVDRTYNTRWSTHRYGSRNETAMKKALAIDPATTYNLYFCNIGGGLLGYATFPDMYAEDSYMHGVVCLFASVPNGGAAPYDEGDTCTHETGHFLGLYHTFQGGCALPNDYCNDTPPESSPAYGCPIGRDTCSGGGADPIENFMDYTDDYCMDTFTSDQSMRMDQQMALYRPTMVGGSSGNPPVAAFTGSPVSGTAPLNVSFSDQSSNSPTNWSWSFGDGGTSTAQNPSHTYNAAGTYTVSLTVANADGSDTETKAGYITATGGSGGGGMHVADISVYRVLGGKKYNGRADITIQDDSGAAVSGATVTAVYSGDASGTASGVTGANGVVTLSTARKTSGTSDFCFEVTDVTHASLTYDAGGNLVTKSCEGGDVFRGSVATVSALHQNVPNPFNPKTEISFTLKSDTSVRLTVYNVKGQAVETLVDASLGAGYHTASFDGCNHPSGVYFYRLETRDYSETLKMIMLK